LRETTDSSSAVRTFRLRWKAESAAPADLETAGAVDEAGRDRNETKESPSMPKILLIICLALASLALGAQALAAPHARAVKTVTVAMRDPGCHWFLVGHKYLKSMTVAGPVQLANFDEAALKIAGPSGVALDQVGKKIALSPGAYHITMVGQAPDDNHLKLIVK
jgi:hypothetical protein